MQRKAKNGVPHFWQYVWDNLERPTKYDFIEQFKTHFNYTASSTVMRIFKDNRATINQQKFLENYLRRRDFWKAIEEGYKELASEKVEA